MPQRLWTTNKKLLNYQQKHLLSFVWWCAPNGCHCWNGRLAKKFKVTPRTIRRWISKLKRLELIAIGHPDGRGRTIWPRYQAKQPVSKPVENLLDPTPKKPKGGQKCPG